MTRRDERGYALIYALMTVLVVGTATSLVVGRSRLVVQETISERARARAFHAAEGGLAMARSSLARDPRYRGGTAEFGGCTVSVRVTAAGANQLLVSVRAEHRAAGSESLPAVCRIEAVVAQGIGLPAVRSWRQLP